MIRAMRTMLFSETVVLVNAVFVVFFVVAAAVVVVAAVAVAAAVAAAAVAAAAAARPSPDPRHQILVYPWRRLRSPRRPRPAAVPGGEGLQPPPAKAEGPPQVGQVHGQASVVVGRTSGPLHGGAGAEAKAHGLGEERKKSSIN